MSVAPIPSDPAARIAQASAFFERHPGTTQATKPDAMRDARLGNGGDVIAFMDWLRDSGRFADPWWSAMDGALINDMLVGEQLPRIC